MGTKCLHLHRCKHRAKWLASVSLLLLSKCLGCYIIGAPIHLANLSYHFCSHMKDPGLSNPEFSFCSVWIVLSLSHSASTPVNAGLSFCFTFKERVTGKTAEDLATRTEKPWDVSLCRVQWAFPNPCTAGRLSGILYGPRCWQQSGYVYITP